MIARFQAVLPYKTRIVNIREYPFQGGCLGCFNCAVSGKCIYKDGFDDFLRDEIQRTGRAQVGGNFLAGVATDEKNPNVEIDNMAATLQYALEHSYVPPQNFYGVGGMKIFRDLIWLMQGMMKADHKFYKAHGQYDFPQKKEPC